MRPSIEDTLLITLSAGFVVAGGILLALGQTRLGVVTVLLFGLALGVFVSAAVRRRTNAVALATPATVEAVGGVRIPQRRGRIAAGFAVLVGIGATFSWAFAGQGLGPLVLGGLLVLLGVGGVLSVAAGRLGTGWLRFTPLGLEIGDRTGAATLSWEDVVGVQVGFVQRNAIVIVTLRGAEAAAPRTILAGHYGLDAAWLARAIARYTTEPEARAELAGPRGEIAG